MNFDNNQPIYIQIGTIIKEQILTGTLHTGEKLPSVREYAVIFEVSPLTIHRALQYLEQEQVVATKKGVGSFVREAIRDELSRQMVKGQVHDFVSKMRDYGIADDDIIRLVHSELKGGCME